MRPLPFKARFIPRTDEIRREIEDGAKIAREELRRYDGETSIVSKRIE